MADSEAVETGTLARLRQICDGAPRDYAVVMKSELRALLDIAEALKATRDELDKHGHGDFHYDAPGYRDPDVLAAVENADRALAALSVLDQEAQ